MTSTAQEKTARRTVAPKQARESRSNGRREPSHEEIALRARDLYERSGCQPGRDEEFWLEAERQLRQEHGA